MAEGVTILGMTFTAGEVLTAEKMNRLAGNVATIVAGINGETQRATAAEGAMEKRLASMEKIVQAMQNGSTQAVTAERERAMKAEQALQAQMPSISTAAGTLTAGGVTFKLTRQGAAEFYRGTWSGNVSELRGAANMGLWRIAPAYQQQGVTADWHYLLVVSDSRGSVSSQFVFRNYQEGSVTTGQGGTNCCIRTRYHDGSAWSAWSEIDGDEIKRNAVTAELSQKKLEEQKTEIDSIWSNIGIDDPGTNEPSPDGGGGSGDAPGPNPNG